MIADEPAHFMNGLELTKVIVHSLAIVAPFHASKAS
jgi:hypothetical protein